MAGLNIPKHSELPRGTFLGDVNNARLDAQAKLSDYVQPLPGEWYHTPAVGSISRASDDFNNSPKDPYEAYKRRLELEKLVGASEEEAKDMASKAFRAVIQNNIR